MMKDLQELAAAILRVWLSMTVGLVALVVLGAPLWLFIFGGFYLTWR